MKRRRKGDYHLLVAQNFLGNISRTGKHDDTNLRIFNSSGLKKKSAPRDAIPLPSMEESSSVRFDLDALESVMLLRSTNTFISPRKSYSSPAGPNEDPFSQSYPSRSKSKKTSLLRRFVKILSSDDVIASRDSRFHEQVPLTSRSTRETRSRRDSSGSDDRPPSPLSISNFQFFKRLRASITKGERNYLCSHSTLSPFVVLAHFPFISHERHHGHRLNRSHSTLAASTERMRHISQCSQDELRPYEFHDEDGAEITFGYLFGRKRGMSPCGAIGGIRRNDRRESQFNDSFTRATEGEPSDTTLLTLNSYVTKDFEPEEIEWDDTTGDLYSPVVFDDIDATRKTVIRAKGFVGVTLQYSHPDTVKNALNQTFAEKFPRINLTYSKFKSIKKEMVDLSYGCRIDLSTTAQAITYFERVVIKAIISKSNRKVVAGACLLIALKLNDYGKESIKGLIEATTEKLRITKKDLLALEIPLCAALSFDLQPAPNHIIPHYQKLLIYSS